MKYRNQLKNPEIMATRSTISIKEVNALGNEQYRTVYCHWDGYPSHNGAILLEHYSTIEKVNELISLGSISSLRKNIKPSEKGIRSEYIGGGEYKRTETTNPHTFDEPHDDVVIAYHRDRGEKLVIDTRYSKDAIRGEEYDYLFDDGVWKVRYGKNFVKLTRKMCELD